MQTLTVSLSCDRTAATISNRRLLHVKRRKTKPSTMKTADGFNTLRVISQEQSGFCTSVQVSAPAINLSVASKGIPGQVLQLVTVAVTPQPWNQNSPDRVNLFNPTAVHSRSETRSAYDDELLSLVFSFVFNRYFTNFFSCISLQDSDRIQLMRLC